MTHRRSWRHLASRTVAAVAILISTAVSAYTGQVVDSQTQQGIPHVSVVVQYVGSVAMIVESRRLCFDVDLVQTDDNGNFDVSLVSKKASPLISRQKTNILIYASGYKNPPGPMGSGPRFALDPDHRLPVDRMRDTAILAGHMKCASEDRQREVLLPVYRAIYAEFKALAPQPTLAERGWLSTALFNVERLELGYERASENFSKRKQDGRAK